MVRRCFKCEKKIPFKTSKALQEVYEVIRKKGKDTETAVTAENNEPITYHGTIVLLPLPELPKVRVRICFKKIQHFVKRFL